jgi:hypothetical protein
MHVHNLSGRRYNGVLFSFNNEYYIELCPLCGNLYRPIPVPTVTKLISFFIVLFFVFHFPIECYRVTEILFKVALKTYNLTYIQ